MSYLVLARKWRPKTFDEIVGQATLVRTLKNALASGRIGHAFLFSGARGVGKTTTARILAKALNCSNGAGPTDAPCGSCSSCEEIAAGASLDVQEIDGATHNGVEQVRELRESARYNPARDRFKVWIIDEVHMLSTAAFNALLKTLEEPPPRVKFIFATTEYHKIPDTILSRCQQYDFRLIPTREIQAHLRRVADGEAIQVSDDALGRIARSAEGSVRDALSLFDQVLSFSGAVVHDEDIQALLGLIDRELLTSATRAIVSADSLALLELVERLSDYGADYRNFARELMLHLRELLLVKVVPGESPLLSAILPEERDRLRTLGGELAEEDLLRFLDLLGRLDYELRSSPDARITLEVALLKLAQLRRLMPLTELVARVERLAGGGATLPAPSRAAALPAGVATPSTPSPAAPAPRPKASAATSAAGSTPARVVQTQPLPPAEAAAGGAQDDGPAPPDGAASPALTAQLIQLAGARPSLVQPLRGAEARLEGSTLTLVVPPDFQAFAAMHVDEYRDLAKRALGRTVQVEIVGGQGAAAAGPSPEELRRRELAEKAEQEPAVQEALELFGGRLASVREDESRH